MWRACMRVLAPSPTLCCSQFTPEPQFPNECDVTELPRPEGSANCQALS